MLIERLLFENKVILITGATGTIGGGILKYILSNFYELVKEIRVLSRDEYKLSKLVEDLKDYRKVVPKLGDIRDVEAIKRYTSGVDLVIHSAALKRVEFGEYYPYELVKTNIEGTKNLVDASIESGIERAMMVSTDKAVEPSSTYGATKLCAERIFISGNIDERNNFRTKFSVVRLGNVINSRGSIFEVVKEKKRNMEPVYVTDKNMTRFWITIEEASRFVVRCLSLMEGGEIFIPKMQASRVLDLVKILYPMARIIESKPRPGEKIHEKLISEYEKRICFENDECFVVYPEIVNERKPFDTIYLKHWNRVALSTSFSSDDFTTSEVSDFIEEIEEF
ncbi:MAG: polysaccharide biosynthesis protein [Brevinematia bacterium]